MANVPPVLSDAAGTLAYTENDPASVIDSSLTITDDDDANIESATVSISPFFAGEDQITLSSEFYQIGDGRDLEIFLVNGDIKVEIRNARTSTTIPTSNT